MNSFIWRKTSSIQYVYKDLPKRQIKILIEQPNLLSFFFNISSWSMKFFYVRSMKFFYNRSMKSNIKEIKYSQKQAKRCNFPNQPISMPSKQTFPNKNTSITFNCITQWTPNKERTNYHSSLVVARSTMM